MRPVNNMKNRLFNGFSRFVFAISSQVLTKFHTKCVENATKIGWCITKSDNSLLDYFGITLTQWVNSYGISNQLSELRISECLD